MKEGGELYIRGKLVSYLRLRLFKKHLNAFKPSKHLPFVFFTLTDRDPTIPSNNIRGCQSDTWSAGQETTTGTSTTQSSNESMETKTKTERKTTKRM